MARCDHTTSRPAAWTTAVRTHVCLPFFWKAGENGIWEAPLTSSKKLETCLHVVLPFLSYLSGKHALFLIFHGKPKKQTDQVTWLMGMLVLTLRCPPCAPSRLVPEHKQLKRERAAAKWGGAKPASCLLSSRISQAAEEGSGLHTQATHTYRLGWRIIG